MKSYRLGNAASLNVCWPQIFIWELVWRPASHYWSSRERSATCCLGAVHTSSIQTIHTAIPPLLPVGRSSSFAHYRPLTSNQPVLMETEDAYISPFRSLLVRLQQMATPPPPPPPLLHHLMCKGIYFWFVFNGNKKEKMKRSLSFMPQLTRPFKSLESPRHAISCLPWKLTLLFIKWIFKWI